MREGWIGPGPDLRPHYSREIVVGPLRLYMDVWQGDVDGHEWEYSFQGRCAEGPSLRSCEKAMDAAEILLRGYLRSAARAV